MPRTRKTSHARFMARRILLTIIIMVLLGLLCLAGLYLAKHISPAGATAQSSESQPPDVSAVSSEPVSEPEPEPSSESESESEPEPEPEPEPRSSVDDWELLLVNPSHPLPEDYNPELEAITDNFRVDARIADSVMRMFAHAKEDGISLVICSAYRSVEYQQTLFENKSEELVNEGNTEDEAVAVTATIIAVPGTSEHHTGLAMDIVTPSYTELDEGFAETPAFAWLSKNAADYGFVMRFPKDKQDITKIIYEPWHYRYVGVTNAKLMNSAGMCLEEYVTALKNGTPLPNLTESSVPDDETEPDESGADDEDDAQ